MSRLDSVIRRLQAQRACLARAAALIRDLPGPVLELGLGNGRTYDHLREILPDREIFVFERRLAAHPACVPDPEHLLLGDVTETLPRAAMAFARQVALLHSDIGTGDEARNARIAAFIATQLPALMRPGGIVLGDQAFRYLRAEPLALPDGVKPGRYFLYRAK